MGSPLNSVDVVAIRVGILDCDYVDARCSLTRQPEFGQQRTVLARPGRYIAFRSMEAVENPKATPSHAFRQIPHIH